MAQTATSAKAPKGPPDASPAQASTHARPRTAGRHHVDQLPTRSPGQCLHASVSLRRGTRLTHADHPRRQASPPRTHAGAIHAAPVHSARRNGPNTHVPACTQHAPGNKPLCIHQPRARRLQQDRCQCTWHGIWSLSRRRHGDRISGCGSPCGSLFFVLTHFVMELVDVRGNRGRHVR